MRKYELFEPVVLQDELAEPLIAKGTFGVVMELIPPDGLAVEFFGSDGRTIDVALLSQAHVRPATKVEQKKARLVGEKAAERAIAAITENAQRR